jgi:hypothetical protein
MKRIFIIILSHIIGVYSLAQSELPEFGKPNILELKMKDCDFEPGAPAMKILKYEKVELISSRYWTIRSEKIERIKILNQSGYPYAEIEIPFSEENKIKKLSAYIYNIDESGKIIIEKIDRDDIFKKADKKKKKGSYIFTFPGVRPGSVIEYRYIKNEENANYFDIKYIQDEIPTSRCIFKIVYPNNLKTELTFPIGDENIDNTIEKDQPTEYRNTQILSATKIHSFKTEVFMSPIADNLQYMTLKFLYDVILKDSTIKSSPNYNNASWNGISREFMDQPFYANQVKKRLDETGALLDSLKKIDSVENKVEFIYRSVRNKMTWNNEENIVADDVEKAWKTGLGSNAEINLLLLNLLKKAGVECYPLLVRSREYGKANRYWYSLNQFSNINVIVFNKNIFYLLDASKKYNSYKTIPFEVLNRDVLLVDTFRTKWIRIVDKRPFLKQIILLNAALENNGTISGIGNVSFYDYLKQAEILKKKKKDGLISNVYEERTFIKMNTENVKIDSVEEENLENELLPLNQTFSFIYKADFSSGYLFIDPAFLLSFHQNPFIYSSRRTDIDFGSNQYYSIELHLAIPNEFSIEEIPRNLQLSSSDSGIIFTRQITKENNILVCKNIFEIRRTFYSKDEYFMLNEIFKKVFDARNEQIILKKK